MLVRVAYLSSRPELAVANGETAEPPSPGAGSVHHCRNRGKAFGRAAGGIPDFWKIVGLEAEGFFGPSQWEPTAQWTEDFGPSAYDVARSIMDHGATPDYPAAQAYAACLIAQHCLEQVVRAEDELIWQFARDLDCTTFFGRFKIDSSTGLRQGKEIVWVQWQGSQKRIVQPPTIFETKPEYPRTCPP